MSKVEEKFIYAKSEMQSAISNFYQSCSPADIDDDGFMDDINDAVREASGNEFEPWIE